MTMKLSKEQKLLALLLCDIHKELKIKDKMNISLIEQAIHLGHDWALDFAFEEPDTVEDDVGSFVADVLAMYSMIEEGVEALSSTEKKQLETDIAPRGDSKFKGFDGNNEGEYLSAVRLYVNEIGRFQNFHGRDFNSHVPMVQYYQDMLKCYQVECPTGLPGTRPMTYKSLVKVLKC